MLPVAVVVAACAVPAATTPRTAWHRDVARVVEGTDECWARPNALVDKQLVCEPVQVESSAEITIGEHSARRLL